MKLKAILCDFDGTLVGKKNRYNPGTKELLAKIKKAGVRFSTATGRSYFAQVYKVLEELDLFDYHIFNGGALIFNNKENKILFSQPISRNSVKKVINYLKKTKLNFACETIKFAYMNSVIEEPFYADLSSMKPLSELADINSILKILLFGILNRLTEDQVERHINNLGKICKDVSLIKFKYLDRYGMDITSEKATKHTAVLEYERLLNIPRDQIVAIGDGHNDYPLFTACNYKIAMGNAPAELKEIADFVAPTVDNNGTVIALRHIISKFNL